MPSDAHRSVERPSKPSPLVTVVVPAFNRAATIEGTLRSLLEQDYENIEIIVVDDGSSDDTVVRARDVLATREAACVIEQKNAGAPAARNTGLEAARGKYIGFLDSDDTWRPGFVSRLVSALEAAPPGVGCAMAGYQWVDENGNVKKSVRPVAHGYMADVLVRRNVCGATSAGLMSTEAVRQIGGFDTDFPACQDWDLWIRLAKVTEFVSVDEFLFVYLDAEDPGRITKDQRKRLRGLMTIYRKHGKALCKRDPEARAIFMEYLGDVFLRMGRQKTALRMFCGYTRLRPQAVRHWIRVLVVALGVRPPLYDRVMARVQWLFKSIREPLERLVRR